MRATRHGAAPGGRAGDAPLLRKLNLAATVRAFLDHTSLTVSEVCSIVGVSRPTAEELLATLLSEGFVREVRGRPDGERSAGRPARRFEAVAEDFTVVGIDIGAHKVAVAICDLRGNVVAVRRRSVDSSLEPTGRIGAAVRLVKTAVRQSGKSWAQIRAMACGITGVIANGAEVRDLRTVPAGQDLDVYSLPGFDDIDVASEVSERFKHDVLISNDIFLAAAGEQWKGAATEARDLVYMHAGRRLGAAIVIGGQIHNGRRGLAASVGAMKILGWADAMAQLDHESRKLAGSTAGESTGEDLRALFEAAANGDRTAVRTVDRVAEALALGASTLVHAVDPDLVVLGGGLSRTGNVLADPFQRHLAATSLDLPEFRVSLLGDESVALGAARLALDDFKARLLAVQA
ncbi:ROK family transcriptional regulator [Streptomyces aculeolatus]|uniref:ROK family transcriptional regulator n=1 Tax=Streptomyces aculeolatus TaxID=270689 RepID=UPI001CED7B79|nr:ROK family transcriptional regulator [Streptomyces aculeolatus]